VPGGILIRDARAYDALSHRLLLGRLQARIAEDVATATDPGARVLEVGCGPGRLAIALAGRHGLEVTGLDLDPAMIRRAEANATRSRDPLRRPIFVVGDAASLPFGDGSFDRVVSTLSMHHWADPEAGLAEIARVLRPGGRALLWDVRHGAVPLHRHMADPIELVRASSLQVVAAGPWRWPWRISLLVRMELVRPPASPAE
jgi:ubiquinone/menaquinone biosynthesis C-methylase UbiE